MVNFRSIDDWQNHLDEHYSAMRAQRGTDTKLRPLFGLEHGLTDEQFSNLSSSLTAYISKNIPSEAHYLVWIAYSSEFGYKYSGHQFWQSFETETAGWPKLGDYNKIRNWIREYFIMFHEEYGGAKPSGEWAKHFGIICWPITNAILPKDLQIKLAQKLYEVRHYLNKDIIASPEMLGKLIAVESWNTNSRFRNFVKNEQLLGQISASLLVDDETKYNFVEPNTLNRIIQDLEHEREAREWLKTARASSKYHIKGLQTSREQHPLSSINDVRMARDEIQRLGIEPRLLLRPMNSEKTSWRVYLEIPDMSPLLIRFPETQDVLTDTRCYVEGNNGSPLARGRLLHGTQRIHLSRWPEPSKKLLSFETANSQLDFLLKTDCMLRPDPTWLFKIGADGLAREVRSKTYRAKNSYIILTPDNSLADLDMTEAIDVECEGINAVKLELPNRLSDDIETKLGSIGLSSTRTFEIRPAGLAPIFWDGEGHAEWHSSEEQAVQISADFSFAKLELILDDDKDQTVELYASDLKDDYFVLIPKLSPGVHKIDVYNLDGNQTSYLGSLEILILGKTLGFKYTSPLAIQLDPLTPSLEDLWDNKVSIQINGPNSHTVRSDIQLYEEGNENPIGAYNIGSLSLPCLPNDWESIFYKFRKKFNQFEIYNKASSATLNIVSKVLGTIEVSFDRDFTPLRWFVRRETLNLIDDTGEEFIPSIFYAKFEEPDNFIELEHQSQFKFRKSEGIYIAEASEVRSSIIVAKRELKLDELNFDPVLKERQRKLSSAKELVSIYKIWDSARLASNSVEERHKSNVLNKLSSQLFEIICGTKWAALEKSEKSFSAEGNQWNGLIKLSNGIQDGHIQNQLGSKLLGDIEFLSNANLNQLSQYVLTLLGQLGITQKKDNLEWIVEFALKLVRDITETTVWAGDSLSSGLNQLMTNPTIARIARFISIAKLRFSELSLTPKQHDDGRTHAQN